MSTTKKFNNYLQSDNDIKDAKQYIRYKTIPQHLLDSYNKLYGYDTTGMLLKKFKEKYTGFIIRNNQLIYRPTNQKVIPFSKKQQILKSEYNDKSNMGKGVVSFYKYLNTKYININRQDVQDYLNSVPEYQMSKNIKYRINKPIVSKFVNQTWGIDLIDMEPFVNFNNKYKYILTTVDIFSRKTWLNALTNKFSQTIATCINNIIEHEQVKPASIMCDNGTEFQGEFANFCKTNDIKLRNTQTYNPRANGIVENKNNQVRKLIRYMMLKKNTLKWYDEISNIEKNLNTTYNRSIKASSDEVWSNERLDNIPEEEVNVSKKRLAQYEAQNNIIKRVERQIDNYKHLDNFQPGDAVRVKMSALFSQIRKLIKEGKQKLIVVTYAPKIFYINRVIIPRKSNPLERK
jgi:hypothetical protein